MTDSLSKQVVFQRIRNRIIEVLELFSDDEAFDIAISNVEFWHDWVDIEKIDELAPTVLNQDEIAEIIKVDSAWNKVEPNSQKCSKEWVELNYQAKNALIVFLRRGKMSESIENVWCLD